MSEPVLPLWPDIPWSAPADCADGPRILGINPWIYDFAAYNLWQRPVGSAFLPGYLTRSCGCQVALMDCLDPTWRDVPLAQDQAIRYGQFPQDQAAFAGCVCAMCPGNSVATAWRTIAVAGALQAAGSCAGCHFCDLPDDLLVSGRSDCPAPGARNFSEGPPGAWRRLRHTLQQSTRKSSDWPTWWSPVPLKRRITGETFGSFWASQ